MFVLDRLLKRLIRVGTLQVTDHNGVIHHYGTGGEPKAALTLHGRWAAWKILLDPELQVGEAYMDGSLTIEDGDIYQLMDVVLRNVGWMPSIGFFGRISGLARWVIRRLLQYNPVAGAKRNVARHYDLSDALFDLFLDRDRQYSCAYFIRQSDTLEEAQAQKKRHLAAKLLLKPGLRVLDIGSGWGGLGLYLAEATDVDVTGITLSEEQHKVSNERSRQKNLAAQVRFTLADYRQQKGRYDRIVSVGMLEHVGVTHFDAYFRRVAELLTEDGVALIHSIGRSDGPGTTNAWIRKYIFPGGYVPALSEVLPSIEKAGLIVTDLEILRLHYAETLQHWRLRFLANRDKVRPLYDERFCRMWEFYLASSEATFRYGGHMVFQIQLAKSLETVPLTRDYIHEAEATLPLEVVSARSQQAAE